MQFRTEIPPLGGWQGLIAHGRPVLLVGSCFSDNIGRQLVDDLFEATVNPFGPLYNPLSILRAFSMIESGEVPERVCSSGGRFLSFDAHSRVSGNSPEELLECLRHQVARARKAVERAAAVIVTLGTTRYFTLCSDGIAVANCHKQSGKLFAESRLTLAEASLMINDIVLTIKRLNPEAAIIFTVSPLRYPGSDPHLNTLSKSILHIAVSQAVSQYDRTVYFPAYEIMMDDLRDYRFYASDMRHPSDMAVDYIYENFSQSFFSDSTRDIARGARKLTRRFAHRTDAVRDVMSWPEVSIIQSHPELNEAFQQYMSHGV